jgi:predicted protein tyrosine phosphatase
MKIIKQKHSREEISLVEPHRGSVLISITNKDRKHPKVKGFEEILRLHFGDTEEKNDGGITRDDATEIIDFAMTHRNKEIWINCDAGMSRSAGVVVALEEIFNSKDYKDKYEYYNKEVYRMIKDVWFDRCWWGK